jgi:hypothetical protein
MPLKPVTKLPLVETKTITMSKPLINIINISLLYYKLFINNYDKIQVFSNITVRTSNIAKQIIHPDRKCMQ